MARSTTAPPPPSFAPAQIEALFPVFDCDRNGRLDAAEIAAAAEQARLGEQTGVLVSPAA